MSTVMMLRLVDRRRGPCLCRTEKSVSGTHFVGLISRDCRFDTVDEIARLAGQALAKVEGRLA